MVLHSRKLVRKVSKEFHKNVLILTSSTYAPDKLTVRMAKDEYEKICPVVPALCDQLSEFLEGRAKKKGFKLVGDGVTVSVEPDGKLKRGEVVCDGEFSEAAEGNKGEQRNPANRFNALTRFRRRKRSRANHDRNHLEELPAVIPINAGTITLGREDCEVVLAGNTARVSRSHATVTREDGAVYLKDIGSTNGTFVNGRLIENCILQDGDEIRIGDFSLTYSLADEALIVKECAREFDECAN